MRTGAVADRDGAIAGCAIADDAAQRGHHRIVEDIQAAGAVIADDEAGAVGPGVAGDVTGDHDAIADHIYGDRRGVRGAQRILDRVDEDVLPRRAVAKSDKRCSGRGIVGQRAIHIQGDLGARIQCDGRALDQIHGAAGNVHGDDRKIGAVTRIDVSIVAKDVDDNGRVFERCRTVNVCLGRIVLILDLDSERLSTEEPCRIRGRDHQGDRRLGLKIEFLARLQLQLIRNHFEPCITDREAADIVFRVGHVDGADNGAVGVFCDRQIGDLDEARHREHLVVGEVGRILVETDAFHVPETVGPIGTNDRDFGRAGLCDRRTRREAAEDGAVDTATANDGVVEAAALDRFYAGEAVAGSIAIIAGHAARQIDGDGASGAAVIGDVEARTTFEGIGADAPNQNIIVITALEGVVARPTDQNIIAAAADQ